MIRTRSGILAFLILLFPALTDGTRAESGPNEKTASEAGQHALCQGPLEACVERLRRLWSNRGVLGMRVHTPHKESDSVGLEDEDPQSTNRHDTWFVQLVAPVGAAADAGIRPDDQIVGWSGRAMPARPEVFDEWVTTTKAGDKVTLDILRKDGRIRIELTARAPEPWIMEAWLLEYVRRNYPEAEYMKYRANVMSRQRKAK